MELNKPKLNLVGIDGNAFAILAAWRRAAIKAGWPDEEIVRVLEEAKSRDYNNLLCVIMENSEADDED